MTFIKFHTVSELRSRKIQCDSWRYFRCFFKEIIKIQQEKPYICKNRNNSTNLRAFKRRINWTTLPVSTVLYHPVNDIDTYPSDTHSYSLHTISSKIPGNHFISSFTTRTYILKVERAFRVLLINKLFQWNQDFVVYAKVFSMCCHKTTYIYYRWYIVVSV